MDKKYLVVDAHEDLAWNILTFGRNYTRSVAETRRIEKGTPTPERNGDTLLGWDAYQEGRVAFVFATLFACPIRRKEQDWDTLCYADSEQAHRLYRAQLDIYHTLAEKHPDHFVIIQGISELNQLRGKWELPRSESADAPPVGLVLLMEGAEGIREVAELEEWWAGGVRLIGPAWAGTRFCGGTREPGPLTPEGFELLDGMADLGFILDLSHMDEQAALEALDHYPRRMVATHANAKALLKGTESNRHLTDDVITRLVERGGVIGIVPYNTFLVAGWKQGDPRELASLNHVVAQIDYVCQIAGDARHVGFGTDFDGGFGVQSVPPGLDTIADLQKFAPLLEAKGYSEEDIAAIFSGNWLKLLTETLP